MAIQTTTIILEDGTKFTFKMGDPMTVKVNENAITYEVIEIKEPKIGEQLEFSYDMGCSLDEFKSTSKIISIQMI